MWLGVCALPEPGSAPLQSQTISVNNSPASFNTLPSSVCADCSVHGDVPPGALGSLYLSAQHSEDLSVPSRRALAGGGQWVLLTHNARVQSGVIVGRRFCARLFAHPPPLNRGRCLYKHGRVQQIHLTRPALALSSSSSPLVAKFGQLALARTKTVVCEELKFVDIKRTLSSPSPRLGAAICSCRWSFVCRDAVPDNTYNRGTWTRIGKCLFTTH